MSDRIDFITTAPRFGADSAAPNPDGGGAQSRNGANAVAEDSARPSDRSARHSMLSGSDADFERDYNNAVSPRMLPNDDLPPGSLLNNEYEILEKLGTGGMGTVYLARDAQLNDNLLAIKILLADKPKADADHFIKEAQRASKVKSPHVVKIHSFRRAKDGDPMQLTYMVMEYIGQNLETYAEERGGKLDVRTALRFSMQACAALHAAHGAEVVHRDIKPLNCLIRVRETDEGERIEELVVTDFGIARDVRLSPEPSTPEHWTVVGTEGYIAPEILLREPNPDARVDIYGVGAMLFRLLTGHPPPLFPKPTDFEKSDIPEQLVPILQKALAQSPKERYGSARALKSALSAVEGILWGAPIFAPLTPSVAPPSVGDRAEVEGADAPAAKVKETPTKWRGAVVTLLGLFVVVGLAVIVWQLISGDDDSARVTATHASEGQPGQLADAAPKSPPAAQATPSSPQPTPPQDPDQKKPTSPETIPGTPAPTPNAPTTPELKPGKTKPKDKPRSPGTSSASTSSASSGQLPSFAEKEADFKKKLLAFCDHTVPLPCGVKLTPTLRKKHPNKTFTPKLHFTFAAHEKYPTVSWTNVSEKISDEMAFKKCVEEQVHSKGAFDLTSNGGTIACNVAY